jgi:hypothetical protein
MVSSRRSLMKTRVDAILPPKGEAVGNNAPARRHSAHARNVGGVR